VYLKSDFFWHRRRRKEFHTGDNWKLHVLLLIRVDQTLSENPSVAAAAESVWMFIYVHIYLFCVILTRHLIALIASSKLSSFVLILPRGRVGEGDWLMYIKRGQLFVSARYETKSHEGAEEQKFGTSCCVCSHRSCQPSKLISPDHRFRYDRINATT